jgi:hypothetical protein
MKTKVAEILQELTAAVNAKNGAVPLGFSIHFLRDNWADKTGPEGIEGGKDDGMFENLEVVRLVESKKDLR